MGELAVVELTGVVYEDVNYGGGAGRSLAASGTSRLANATVELYSSSGSFISKTTTNSNGAYFFSVSSDADYTVRVVSSTVSSSRPGYVAGLLPVPTYVNGEGNRVGGQAPEKADAPANTSSQSLASLSTPTTTPQALARVVVGAGGLAGVNFGFNFSTIVNANLSGQGSLRQFVINSNVLGGEASLAQSGTRLTTSGIVQPLPAGKETSIFMVPNGGTTAAGTVRPGFRSFDGSAQGGPASGLNANGVVAIVSPTGGFVEVSSPDTYLDGTTQTANIGNTNNVILGTGGTVGVEDSVLVQLNGPEVQLRGGRRAVGFFFTEGATNSVLRGLSVYGFEYNVWANVNNQRLLVEGNVFGTSATSFTDPGADARTVASNLYFPQAVNAVIRQNLIGFAGASGIYFHVDGGGHVVRNNEIRGNGLEFKFRGDGIELSDRVHHATVVGNLVVNNGCEGIDSYNENDVSRGGSNTVRNNTISNNGFGNFEGQGIHWWNNNNAVTLNKITGNRLNGVAVSNGARGNVFSRNSFNGNSGLALDLASVDNDTGDGPTRNDAGDADSGSNEFLNFPVLETATVQQDELLVRGFARPGALVELFIAAPHPSGFGGGQTYLASFAEGGAEDADASTGSYGPGLINGLAQGQDNTNKFSFRLSLASLSAAQKAALLAGAQLTATATLGGATSEFSGNAQASILLKGIVYEDVNYGGGAGRPASTPGTSPRPGVRVELYNSAGAFLASTVTDAAGSYEFNPPAGSYTVRVVSSTVSSSRPGYVAGLLPVPTYVNGEGNRVGGQAPEKADAPANTSSQSLASLSTPTTTPQALARVTLVDGSVDFGFNFDVVVNTNGAGQGSLRQFILNSNALGDESSLAQAGSNAAGALPAGRETSIFMIADGQAHPGLHATTDGGPTSQLTAGVAVIILPNTTISQLPVITGAFTRIDGGTQSANIGQTNGGADTKYVGGSTAAVGTGPDGIVGTNDDFKLTGVDAPEVQLQGRGLTGNVNTGLTVQADDVTLRGLALLGFRNQDVLTAQTNGATTNRLLVENNVFGAAAAALADPAGNTRSFRGLDLVGLSTGTTIRNNVFAFVQERAIKVSDGNQQQLAIEDSEFRNCGLATTGLAYNEAICLEDQYSDVTVRRNLVDKSTVTSAVIDHLLEVRYTTASSGAGVLTIEDNSLVGSVRQGILLWPSNAVNLAATVGKTAAIRHNIIRDGRSGDAISQNTYVSTIISENSIFNNGSTSTSDGELGLDLLASPPATVNPGPTGDGVTLNDLDDTDTGANGLLNFPVLTSATLQDDELVVRGFARPGALIELFVAAADPSGFGEGKTFLVSRAEGSAADTDTGTGSYGPGRINGLAQGQDNTNKFTLRLPLSSLTSDQQVSVLTTGAYLTATATLDGATSEFSGNVLVSMPFTGVVYEDVNYGGGAGRTLVASGGVPRPGATVELYDNAGVLVATATTDAAGQYSFNVLAGTYTVRVVSGTVSSSRPGYVAGLVPVPVYSGAEDHVGGQAPEKEDAPANTGSQKLTDLTTTTTTAQAVASVTVSLTNSVGPNFGFNFSTIVNTNVSGQGSLRQFILNSNALGGESSLAQAGENPAGPLPAERETSIFMITDGQTHPGLRAGLSNQLPAGVAVIILSNATTGQLPAITGSFTQVDGGTQSVNVGQTNGGSDSKYAGGSTTTVGTGPDGVMGTGDEFTLTGVDAPEIQLQGPGAGLVVRADDVTLRGLALVGFTTDLLITGTGADPTDRLLVENNVFGSAATGLADPLGSARSSRSVDLRGVSTGITIRNNVFAFIRSTVIISSSSSGTHQQLSIENNEFRNCGLNSANAENENFLLSDRMVDLSVRRNLFDKSAMTKVGFDHYIEVRYVVAGPGSMTFEDNSMVGALGQSIAFVQTQLGRSVDKTATVRHNIMRDGRTSDAVSQTTSARVLITENSIFNNELSGIDLGRIAISSLGDGLTLNDANDADTGANDLLNFPVLTTATVQQGELLVRGFARPGALVELFVAAPHPSGFGEGQTYLVSRTEGTGEDTDSGTGAYSGLINGINQGQDNTNRFTFSIPLSSLTPAQQAALNVCGVKLTSTATLGGSTSEFSGVVTVGPTPVDIRVVGTSPLCAGETARLSTEPRPGYLFTWYNGSTVVNGNGAVLDDSVFVASASGSYTVQVTVAGCAASASVTSAPVAITVLPTVTAGSIGTDQTVCTGAQPAPLVSLTDADGGSGTYLYQWETSPDNTTWTDIAGATSTTYEPGPVTTTTYLRRRATSGTCDPVYTASVTLTVLPTLTAGSIGADQTVCANATPAPLTSTTDAAGGTGIYAYQWETSSDNVAWTTVSGATSADYAPGPIAATTHFRRQVTSGDGNCATSLSNTVTLTVPSTLLAGSIGADQTFCANATPAPLTSTAAASGGTGSYSYQWQSSVDNITWEAISGATNSGYAPGPVAVTTYFRRQVTSGAGSCATSSSNTVTLTVSPTLLAGSTQADQTVCAGSTPAPFTSVTTASGGSGSYSYQWESSVDNVTWAAISAATSADYASGPIAATTYFRRQVTSGTGACGTAYANTVTVTVSPTLTAGSIGTNQTVCANATPASLTSTADASGGTGTYSYQWESSVDNITWGAISEATSASYAPGPVAVTTYFRRQVTSGTGNCATSSSNTVTLTVLPILTAGSIGADQTVCANATPAPLTSTTEAAGGTGSYSYQWESSVDNVTWTTVSGATAATYAPSPIAATTHFRRQVTSGTGNCATASSNTVTLTVSPTLLAGSIGADQTFCANATPAPLTSTAAASGGTGSYSYQWQSSVDNITWGAISGATNSGYAPGPIAATTYFRRQVTSGGSGCSSAVSNAVALTVTPTQVASVSLATPAAQCIGSTLTFTPTSTNGGPTPTFRWFVNNSLAATSPTFTSSTLANNDQVRVEMTPTSGLCLSGTPTASITVTLTPTVVPTLSIRQASGPACVGTVLSFNIDNVTGAGGTPQYQWLLNGNVVPGSTGVTFSSATLRDGDRVQLQLTSSESCASSDMVLSNEVVIRLLVDTPPVVSIAGSGITCAGQPVSFTITSSTNLGTSPAYQWQIDGTDVAGAQGATFSSTSLRSGQAVTLVVRATTTCGSATVVSNAVQTSILSVIDVEAGPDKEIMEGESVVLEGTANGTYSIEWTPAQSLSFPSGDLLRPVASPTVTTVYKLKAMVNGCQDESSVTVKVGPPIRIPSAFSPNGDRTNDTWEIDRIGSFTGNTVTIFNRWGNKVYSTTNYSLTNQWNGRINGQAAPIGTYYYVITLGTGKTFSGPLTIVY